MHFGAFRIFMCISRKIVGRLFVFMKFVSVSMAQFLRVSAKRDLQTLISKMQYAGYCVISWGGNTTMRKAQEFSTWVDIQPWKN